VKTMESVIALVLACQARNVGWTLFSLPCESLIGRGRNVCACKFLSSGCTHMIFIDADIVFEESSVFKLIDADKDVIGGVYAKKCLRIEDIKERAQDCASVKELCERCALLASNEIEGTPRSGLQHVLYLPTGFMLLRRTALEALIEQHGSSLQYVNDIGAYKHCTYNGYMYNFFPSEIHNGRLLSEDYGFCALWQSIEGELYADYSIKLAHIGQFWFYSNPELNG